MRLIKSLVTVSSVTLISRLLGFIRDTIIARVFGVGLTTDAFFIAFKLPNLLRRIFAEGAFSQAFIPVLVEYRNKQNKENIRRFISDVSGSLILVVTIIAIIGVLLAPQLIMIMVPGFIKNLDKFNLTSLLLRNIFPYIVLISIASLISSILNTWNYFFIPASSMILLNISIIIFTLLDKSYFNPPILILIIAIIVGGVLQVIYQLPNLKKIDMLVIPRVNFQNPNVLNVIKRMYPIVINSLINQASMIINTTYASFLVSGSISWMYYADRLLEFPSGILNITISTTLMPLLAKSFFDNNYYKHCQLFDWGLRFCILLALPSTVALSVLAEPLVVTLFQYGKFTAIDTLMTQKALTIYSIGVTGSILTKLLSTEFYSRQNFKTPVIVAIITLMITQLINLLLLNLLKYIGLSISVGLSSCINASILFWQLRKKNIFIPQPGWKSFLLKLTIALLVMIITLIGILQIMPDWSLGNMMYRILRLIIVSLIGMLSYFFILSILGFKIKKFIQYTI